MSDDVIDGYDYELPAARIAQRPAPRRDASRLLVHRREVGETRHRRFDQLAGELTRGDLLVLNDTRVIPARIRARKPTGARVELLLLQPLDEQGGWEALVRPSARVQPGSEVLPERGGPALQVGETLDGGHRRVILPAGTRLEELGEPPLPPYIERPDGVTAEDWDRYQTIYAAHDGAVAAPTAGLHVSEQVLAALDAAGVEQTRVTLHVGSGTFEPMRARQLDEHRMHGERYRVPAAAARAIERTRRRGGRVIAIGTTVVRTLEAWAREGHPDDGAERTTELFLRPGEPFLAIDGMVTNFHLPRSSLLVLVGAWLGRERVLALYREALEAGYRFYSYGDAMLLL